MYFHGTHGNAQHRRDIAIVAAGYRAALGYRGERADHQRKGLRGLAGSDYLKGMGKVEGNASALLNLGYSPLPGVQLSVAGAPPPRPAVPLSIYHRFFRRAQTKSMLAAFLLR